MNRNSVYLLTFSLLTLVISLVVGLSSILFSDNYTISNEKGIDIFVILKISYAISLTLILISLTLLFIYLYYEIRTYRQAIAIFQNIMGNSNKGVISFDQYTNVVNMIKYLYQEYLLLKEELSFERHKLNVVLNQISDGLMIIDQQSQVLIINKVASRIFDLEENVAVGSTLASVVRHHQLIELWQRCRDTGEAQIIAFEIPRKRLFIQCFALPMKQDDTNLYILFIQDLTALKRLETIRRDFISNISHELRTPLASLKALTETLLTGALEELQTSQHFIQRIDAEVDSLSMLVQELLELSRIESGKVPLRLEAFSPNLLISNVVTRMKLQVERAGLILNVEYPDDLPPVLVDPSRIEQVFTNLLHNAIKFTPSGGNITISANLQGDMILFSVKDTGIGISSDDIPRIFERFYKSDKARSSSGVGLGLAIARHIVEAHHGEIHVESKEGHGSTFSFSIPIAK